MNFTTISRWEFKESLKSKKFLMIFFLQLSVLFLMIFVFNSFATNIQSEKGISLTPSLSGFASLDVDDQGQLFSKYINPEIIDIKASNSNTSVKRLEEGKTTGFVMVSEDSLDRINRMETINVELYLDYRDPKRSVIRDEVNATAKIMANAISTSWIDSLTPQNTTQTVVNQENTGEPLSLQIIRKAMIAILLFLPLFLFGNMVIDSVVGEKERKTGEILMAMPLSPADIILGKSIAVIGIIALQVALWMIILLTAGFEIKSPIIVYILILMTSIPIIGVTTIVTAYAKNYKEAGIGITFAYIGVVGFLIVPALAYLSGQSLLANISPMTMVMRLFSGEAIPFWQFFIPITFVLLVSAVSYGISIKLFERDDVVFGPRPGIIRLIIELTGFKKVLKSDSN